jgi:uncharacterized cupin superfamily protein
MLVYSEESRRRGSAHVVQRKAWRTPFYDRAVVSEAPLAATEHGLVPASDVWFVLNARETRWFDREGRGVAGDFDGGPEFPFAFPQLGIGIYVLGPGEPMTMYHWEAAQEDFLVISGEGLLIVEGDERPLRAWDFVHCPPETTHVIVGAGDGPCVVVAVGARDRTRGRDWGGYTVDQAALRHGAGAEEETDDPKQAYARFRPSEPTRYRDGWLPG